MIGGSTGAGGVGLVGGGTAGPFPDEPPHVDAAAASAIVTNEEKIFRRR
jgi:hypothetical protein